jgi:adenosylmethionine---8-amino-7-oxononanoate aminotransferase
MVTSLTELDQSYIWHPFTQQATASDPIPIVRGSGAYLYDEHNKAYLDLISSWWVNTHGHAHPEIAKAIAKQAATLEQVIFAGFTHEPAIQLACQLVERAPMLLQKVFFSDNGSTAVEVALKLALQYWQNQARPRRRIVALEGAYHGDTFGAMAVGKSSNFFKPFEVYLFSVDYLPFPETWMTDEEIEQKENQALEVAARYFATHGADIAALIVEPLIQGASGMRFCRPVYLQRLLELARESGALIIFDEIMTGFGRTGTLFACEQMEDKPDLLCLSKGLTGGFLPLSVTLCSQQVYQAFLDDDFSKAFAHGHSFTANPLGCAAANANLRLFETEKSLVKIQEIHQVHKERLALLAKIPDVTQLRTMGPIAAFNLKGARGYSAPIGSLLKQAFLEQGLIIRPLGNVVYLLPPYCIALSDLHQSYDQIEKILLNLTNI